MDATGDGCPTIQDLVGAKRLDLSTANDPWGKPFRIVCGEGDIRVISSGNDRKDGSPDDVRDDFTPVDVKKAKEL